MGNEITQSEGHLDQRLFLSMFSPLAEWSQIAIDILFITDSFKVHLKKLKPLDVSFRGSHAYRWASTYKVIGSYLIQRNLYLFYSYYWYKHRLDDFVICW